MTKIITLSGAPGAGKSTLAAALFSELKQCGVNAELVTEYVKQWAWEGRVPENFDQFYFFGKQTRREYTLLGKVDTVVTDSPVFLSGFYAKIHGDKEQEKLFKDMVKYYMKMVQSKGNYYEHYFLNRVKEYNPKGRYHTEEQSDEISGQLIDYMLELGLKFKIIDGDKNKLFDEVFYSD